jgi:hypothetical protein
MLLEIDEEIINKATKCNKHFACLNDKGHSCCKVVHIIQDSLCFIDPDKWQHCNYYTAFGYSDICNCPVRVEIYRKYKK